ncbi:MAG: hypothetical protein ACE5JH_12215 [Acidobacteriota bacterium]
MSAYGLFLTLMSGLFAVCAALLLGLALAQTLRRRGRRAIVYLGLTLVATIVAAGFYFVRRLL